jgi:hypothetical protein
MPKNILKISLDNSNINYNYPVGNKMFHPSIDKNLVYSRAESWAKQNIDDLFKEVFNWCFAEFKPKETVFQCKNIIILISEFYEKLYTMNLMLESTDKERENKLLEILEKIAKINKMELSEEIRNRVRTIFLIK